MADETTTPQGGGAMDFFKDPRNLATGLVFLAALAQPRRQGQSGLGAFGERAVGALAFRGGLDKGIRSQRMQDEAAADERLERSRQEEFRQQQLTNQGTGLEIQREGMSQAERLAQAQNENAIALKKTPSGMNPAEEALMRAQTGYYNRMPKDSAGKGMGLFGMIDPQMLQDISKLQWEQEVKQAALEGRQPDTVKVMNSLLDFMNQAQMASAYPGGNIRRNTDGTLGFFIPPQPGAGVTPPENAGGALPQNVVPAQLPVPGASGGVDFSSDVPITPPQAATPQAAPGGRRGGGVSRIDVEAMNLEKLPKEQLLAWLRDPRLTPEQRLKVSDAYNGRGPAARARAELVNKYLSGTVRDSKAKKPLDPNRPY